MEIVLDINGKETTFKTGKVTVRLYRKTVDLHSAWVAGEFMPKGYTSKDIDQAIEYICEVFGNQFTLDDFLDGYEMNDSLDFMVLINGCMDNVLFNGGKVEKSEKKA